MKKHIISLILLIMYISAGICNAGSLTVESDSQEFKDSDKKIYLEGNVKVKNNDAHVVSPRAVVELDPKNNKVNRVEFKEQAYSWQLKDGKKHEIKAQILKMSLLNKVFTAEGKTISSITEKDKPVVIVTADRQEYNKTTNMMKAFGNVNILYKDVETFSSEAYVSLNDKNDVKKIDLVGNARLHKGKNKINAKKVTYDNIKEEAVATGDVYTDLTTEDEKRVEIWSDYQSYNKKANFVNASGKTKIVYEDYTATGPKVNVYADKKTNKLNEAVFVGRSKIETKGRTIEADRITITMNPKDFKAEGHVKSVIPNVN